MVTAQAPRSNVTVVRGSNVVLYSNGYSFFNSEVSEETELVEVPDVVNKGLEDRIMARDRLEAAGLVIDYDPNACVGYAVSQSYPAGQKVPRGTVVYVTFEVKE